MNSKAEVEVAEQLKIGQNNSKRTNTLQFRMHVHVPIKLKLSYL